MDFYKLLVLQFIAHFLSDYFFQSPDWSKEKDEKGFRTNVLYKHGILTFIFSAFMAFDFLFIVFSLLISAVHLVLDGLKNKFTTIGIPEKFIFFIDQAVHLIIIFTVVYFYDILFEIHFYTCLPELRYLIYLFVFLLMLKPSNIFIREIFLFFEITLTDDQFKEEELPNAGKLIGNIERVLCLLLILSGEFAVIGFLLAAKSLLRFREAQAQKAEYVLIGTLLSFAIAIIAGIFVEYVTKLI